MHIPDGFINGATSLGAGVVALGGLGASLRQTGTYLKERQVPLAGLIAAFIFALQMINFPVAAGTSGHLLGGALAAVLIGPWAGVVVMSVVVIVQALLFADGGVSALGLNVLNMAVITTLVGWAVFRLAARVLPKSRVGIVTAAFTAAVLSVVASATGFVIEYGIGGNGGAPLGTVLTAMVGVHVLIGIGEGLITATAVGAVLSARPDLVYGARDLSESRGERGWASSASLGGVVIVGLLVTLLLAVFASPFASTDPDGLERVAIDQGFADTAQDHTLGGSPLADYSVEGVEGGTATGLAGLVGVGATFAVGLGVLGIRRARRSRRTAAADR